MKYIKDNIVENYLKENAGKSLSIKNIYKQLCIKRRLAIYMANHSKNIEKVKPFVVGSGKYNLLVFKYNQAV